MPISELLRLGALRSFKEAAASAIHAGPFHIMYERLVGAGIRPELARLTLARKIASVVLAVWKKGVPFDPTLMNPAPAAPIR